ncbi:MAG: FadR/GntR family transcriptional regulator [Devosia sp.]|nr:FadR/GntR family transcriptional regulator [Devosia sp.]
MESPPASAGALPLAHASRDDGLAGQVVTYVRDYIASHNMRPGDRLPGEAEVARVLGVSRPVVREASRTLAALGLVDIAPGRPPRVSRMRGRALRHFFEHALMTGQAGAHHVLEVRRGLEISMAALAAARRDAAAISRLTELVGLMGAKLHQPEEFVVWDLEFHRTIAAATANPFYVKIIDACRAAFESSMDVGLRHRFTATELDRVQALHVQILEAIRLADVDAAVLAMTRHFDDALAAVYRGPRPTPARRSTLNG